VQEENEVDPRFKNYFDALNAEIKKRKMRKVFSIAGPNLNEEGVKELVDMLATFSDKLKYSQTPSEDVKTLSHASHCFALLGYELMAEKLSLIELKLNLLQSHFIEFMDENYKAEDSDKRRKNASGPKHKLYPEILDIMIATWDKNKHASKRQMIKKLKDEFGPSVSKSALKDWIALHELGPDKNVAGKGPSKDFKLVFPRRNQG